MEPTNSLRRDDIAILLIEFQKTWTEKSLFYKLIRNQYESRNVYGNTVNILEMARKKGLLVIQAPLVIDKRDKEKYKQMPLPPKLLGQFSADTWRSEYTDGIFSKTDIEVSGRCGFDACIGSNLQRILKARRVKMVYFAGFTTDHCVADTMNTLISEGYECVLISDCTATRNSRLQKKIEKKYQSIQSKKLAEELENLA